MKPAEFAGKMVEIEAAALLDTSEWNGYMVRKSGTGAVYLVDRGARRFLTRAIFDSLFRRGARVMDLPSLDGLPEDSPYPEGTCLIRPGNNPAVYLYEAGSPGGRRFISGTAFNQYQLDMNKVQSWPWPLFSLVPEVDVLPERPA
jgi:hypothetical protein